MSECECLNGCPFFSETMKGMPLKTKELKNKYCLGDNKNCARYMVFKVLGKGKVPPDLFPTQIKEAENIIKDK